jgi:hypothetical protein
MYVLIFKKFKLKGKIEIERELDGALFFSLSLFHIKLIKFCLKKGFNRT